MFYLLLNNFSPFLEKHGFYRQTRAAQDDLADVNILPAFTLPNWPTYKSMGQRREVFLPYPFLMTLFLERNEFLVWWVHVRFSTKRTDNATGVSWLEASILPDEQEPRSIVRQELHDFIKPIKFV